MKKRTAGWVLPPAMCLLAVACENATERIVIGCDPPGACEPYKDLTTKTDVLYNLERSMYERDVVEFVRLLDPDQFIFQFWGDTFGHTDVTIPRSWGYDDETQAAAVLMNKGGGVDDDPVVSVSLDLIDRGNAQWVEFNPVDHPGWFRTTLGYAFLVVTLNETIYISPENANAQITIRQRDVDGKMIWRIVEWADDMSASAAAPVAAGGNEAISWSVLKALYPPQ